MTVLREIPQKKYTGTLPDGFEITELRMGSMSLGDYLRKVARIRYSDKKIPVRKPIFR